MAGQIKQDRVFGNFKPPKGYAKPKRGNSKNYENRPGMSPKHLDCIRRCQCCVCGSPPRSEAHHLKAGTRERGMGIRSTDKHSVPLCRTCHQEVEAAGAKKEEVWFTSRRLDALAIALALWGSSGDVDQMQRIIRAHKEFR